MSNKTTKLAIFALALFSISNVTAKSNVAEERDGFVVVEAENFNRQYKNKVREWIVIDKDSDLTPFDCEYYAGASNDSYIQILPDTRRTHKDKLIQGENFTNIAGDMAIVSYKINFTTPGKYYVWVSCYSSNSEDNGVHVGIDGTWPESGQRMQWCVGKNSWFWGSAQRTDLVHCGVPGEIWIEVLTAGIHTIEFSMREDGFAMDRFALSKAWNISNKSNIVGEVFIPEGLDPVLLGPQKVTK